MMTGSEDIEIEHPVKYLISKIEKLTISQPNFP